jgi:hypothetical protein
MRQPKIREIRKNHQPKFRVIRVIRGLKNFADSSHLRIKN